MEAEIPTVLHGATFRRAFLPACHPSSTDGRLVFDPVPAPWHYRVDPDRWLKVQPASEAEEAQHEAQVLAELHESGVRCIPSLYGVLRFSNGCVGLLEANCGSPFKHPKSEAELILFASHAAACLAELHSAGWVHGDVKESNFCLNASGQVTLIDLEYAVRLGAMPHGYTEGYRAPETSASEMPSYTSQSDMYSFGVALRHLVEALDDEIDEFFFEGSVWSELTKALTADDPSKRPTAAEVMERVQAVDSESPERITSSRNAAEGSSKRSRIELSASQGASQAPVVFEKMHSY